MFKAIKLCYISTHRRLDVVRTSYLSLLTVICGFLFGIPQKSNYNEQESG